MTATLLQSMTTIAFAAVMPLYLRLSALPVMQSVSLGVFVLTILLLLLSMIRRHRYSSPQRSQPARRAVLRFRFESANEVAEYEFAKLPTELDRTGLGSTAPIVDFRENRALLNSATPVLVNGVAVCRAALRTGDRIRFGRSLWLYRGIELRQNGVTVARRKRALPFLGAAAALAAGAIFFAPLVLTRMRPGVPGETELSAPSAAAKPQNAGHGVAFVAEPGSEAASTTGDPRPAVLLSSHFGSGGIVVENPHIPPLVPTAAETRTIDRIMAHMSLEQKIGQHFMGHVPRAGLDPRMVSDIRNGLYGGFILYPWNYTTEAGVIKLTGALKAAAESGRQPVGLFLAADQEGGRVDAFRFGHLAMFPAAFYMGEYHNPAIEWAEGYINAVQLRHLGLNMVFAPVLGLYPKPDHTIIGDRSMGPSAKTVSELGLAYIWGAQEGGIIPVAKHFPGHGATTVNSHGYLPIVDYTKSELMHRDIRPFVAAIHGGVQAMMTAHILYPKIDSTYPVTLSTIFLQDILRQQLGFQGIIITDGLSMGALRNNYSLHETLRRAFDAGDDILLDHAVYYVPSLVRETAAMVRNGEIPESTLDRGLRKILLLKLRHGLIMPPSRKSSPAVALHDSAEPSE